jgi:quinolinate synthase
MISNTTIPETPKEKISPFERKETIIGSTTRLYRGIINSSTEKHIHKIAKHADIYQKIQEEQVAKKVVFALRDRCLRPYMHIPSNEELLTAFEALRSLWFLLPPIERHIGETNKKYFLRTLDEVGRFRGIDMFSKD